MMTVPNTEILKYPSLFIIGSHLTLHLKSNTQSSQNASNSTEKIRETIARNLLLQYENWQPRVRYKTLLDPTSDDLRKLCVSLRKSARTERILLHYNGHGVPRPTRNGELWVFNKQFTQYIPVNVADVVTWAGWPAVWILDCPAAAFLSHALQKVVTSFSAESSHGSTNNTDNGTLSTNYTACTAITNTSITNGQQSQQNNDSSNDPLKLIVFSACDSQETLPFTPSLPADILTSCLTTPLDMAIRWHCHIGGPLLPKSLSIASALQIPGKLSDRRTPFGELNWIFTAITDTIAWLVLPRDLFRRLYRQDLLIASLARNYLLAQRILKSLYCTASTYPALPPTHQHNLWTLWDHALDTLLAQMSEITGNKLNSNSVNQIDTNTHIRISQSTFFPDQLDAFELWLSQHRHIPPVQISGPPDQLPAALQVLLSQNLRPRALKLFADFCDFGPWACLECLHVGIHPYILKLIGNNNTSVAGNTVTRSLLHIWTRLMGVDSSCKNDLLKDSAFVYFVNAFAVEPKLAAKALVTFCLDNPAGKEALMNNETFINLLKNMTITDSQDTEEVICKHLLLNQFPGNFVNSAFLANETPEIRAAAILALNLDNPQTTEILREMVCDASPLVRLEILNKISVDRDGYFDILNVLKQDPFHEIAVRADSNQILKSNFAANFVNNFDNLKNPTIDRSRDKSRVLNQLEIDAWLERPPQHHKLDHQIAVLEAPNVITEIFFHPSLPLVYFLDSSGILRCWDWQDDPDAEFDQLESLKTGGSVKSLIIKDFIYSADPSGLIRIHDLSEFKTLQSAFNCRDTNPMMLQCKNGSVLIVGDTKASLYNPDSQKLTVSRSDNLLVFILFILVCNPNRVSSYCPD